MKLTVKTLKGGKFDIEAEVEQTVADVKGIIVRLVSSHEQHVRLPPHFSLIVSFRMVSIANNKIGSRFFRIEIDSFWKSVER